MKRSGVDPKAINYVTVGNTIPTESRSAYVARVASIQAGLPAVRRVDMNHQPSKAVFSPPLLDAMTDILGPEVTQRPGYRRALIEPLAERTLGAADRAALQHRGLSDAEIDGRGYRTHGVRGRSRLARARRHGPVRQRPGNRSLPHHRGAHLRLAGLPRRRDPPMVTRPAARAVRA